MFNCLFLCTFTISTVLATNLIKVVTNSFTSIILTEGFLHLRDKDKVYSTNRPIVNYHHHSTDTNDIYIRDHSPKQQECPTINKKSTRKSVKRMPTSPSKRDSKLVRRFSPDKFLPRRSPPPPKADSSPPERKHSSSKRKRFSIKEAAYRTPSPFPKDLPKKSHSKSPKRASSSPRDSPFIKKLKKSSSFRKTSSPSSSRSPSTPSSFKKTSSNPTPDIHQSRDFQQSFGRSGPPVERGFLVDPRPLSEWNGWTSGSSSDESGWDFSTLKDF